MMYSEFIEMSGNSESYISFKEDTHEIENMCLSIAMMTIDYCYSIHRDLLFYRVDCIRSWID